MQDTQDTQDMQGTHDMQDTQDLQDMQGTHDAYAQQPTQDVYMQQGVQDAHGIQEIIIDEESFLSAGEVHAHLARELAFPSYYGANLDALNDCLEDIDTPVALTVYLADKGVQDEEYTTWFPKLVRSLLRAARSNENLEVIVHAASFAPLARLAACPGLAQLLEDETFLTQCVIAALSSAK